MFTLCCTGWRTWCRTFYQGTWIVASRPKIRWIERPTWAVMSWAVKITMPSHSEETLEHTPSSLPKFHIAPEKLPSQTFPIGKHSSKQQFSGAMLNFRDVRQKIPNLSEDFRIINSWGVFFCWVCVFSRGGGFKYFFIFTLTWGRFPFWRAYFSTGLVWNHQLVFFCLGLFKLENFGKSTRFGALGP